MKTLQNSRV